MIFKRWVLSLIGTDVQRLTWVFTDNKMSFNRIWSKICTKHMTSRNVDLNQPSHVDAALFKQFGSRSDLTKIVSEYDQEIPQSQTADKPMAPRGRATQQSRDTRKTN